jgi:hypothetical protein
LKARPLHFYSDKRSSGYVIATVIVEPPSMGIHSARHRFDAILDDDRRRSLDVPPKFSK